MVAAALSARDVNRDRSDDAAGHAPARFTSRPGQVAHVIQAFDPDSDPDGQFSRMDGPSTTWPRPRLITTAVIAALIGVPPQDRHLLHGAAQALTAWSPPAVATPATTS